MIISNRVAFWDGENFVVVTKNCSKEQANKILKAMADADLNDVEMAEESYAEPVIEEELAIPDISSAIDAPAEDVPAKKITLNNKKYHGMTPDEVLARDGYAGFANLAYIRDHSNDSATKTEIDRSLSAYFKNRFGRVKDPYRSVTRYDMDQCKKFFLYFAGILPEEKQEELAQKAGAIDFQIMLKEASLEELQSLIAAVIEKYA